MAATAFESGVITSKRALWQGRANVDRYVEQVNVEHGPQSLKNSIETDILRREVRGVDVLDVGIGTGRVSLPLVQDGLRLTGLDASATMIEHCRRDARAIDVKLVHADLGQIPFEAEEFDTVISVDAFAHYPNWRANLDELVRVTRPGGRIIIDVGSLDHIAAVARYRHCRPDEVRATEMSYPAAYVLRISVAELQLFCSERDISLESLFPYGVVFGNLVPNYWITESYAFRSGAIDRLVSWIGADPLLHAAAEFVERRVVQELGPSISGRMFAVLERRSGASAYAEPRATEFVSRDERGSAAWYADVVGHFQHEPNRAFVVALLLAAWPMRVGATIRDQLPNLMLGELERAERAMRIDDICSEIVATWTAASPDLTFHGVDLAPVFAEPLEHELRKRLEVSR